jgi:hypothetical protein
MYVFSTYLHLCYILLSILLLSIDIIFSHFFILFFLQEESLHPFAPRGGQPSVLPAASWLRHQSLSRRWWAAQWLAPDVRTTPLVTSWSWGRGQLCYMLAMMCVVSVKCSNCTICNQLLIPPCLYDMYMQLGNVTHLICTYYVFNKFVWTM